MALSSAKTVATDIAIAADMAEAPDMRVADVVFASMAIAYENSWDSTGDDVATTATAIANVIATFIATVSVSIPRLVSSKA